MINGIPDGVDVEIGSSAGPESLLHGSLLAGVGRGIVEPVSVDSASCPCESPRDRGVGVGFVHHGDLVGELGVSALVLSTGAISWEDTHGTLPPATVESLLTT